MLRRCAVTAFQPRSVTAFQYGLLVRVVGVHARSGRTGAAMFSACPALGGCKLEHQRLVNQAHGSRTPWAIKCSQNMRGCSTSAPTRRGHCTSGCNVLYISCLLPHVFSLHRVVLYRLPPLPAHQTIQEQPPEPRSCGGVAACFGTARSWSRPQPRRPVAFTSGVAAT